MKDELDKECTLKVELSAKEEFIEELKKEIAGLKKKNEVLIKRI